MQTGTWLVGISDSFDMGGNTTHQHCRPMGLLARESPLIATHEDLTDKPARLSEPTKSSAATLPFVIGRTRRKFDLLKKPDLLLFSL